MTLTITGSNAAVAGFGSITPVSPSDSDETSFVEGTLTYYFLSGESIVGSVGIQPSTQIYLTTIPFDTFANMALALANGNSAAVTVQLTLFSASDQIVSTQSLQLQPNGHIAEYLSQIFSNVQMSGERVDIECDSPIWGTAVTDVNGQFSSLPFLPAVKAYTFTGTLPGGDTITGTVGVRINGPASGMYPIAQTKNGQPVQSNGGYYTGTYINGVLKFYTYEENTDSTNIPDFQRFVFSPFSLSMQTVLGTLQQWSTNPLAYVGSGQLTLTAIN